jgi:hypothetical protein
MAEEPLIPEYGWAALTTGDRPKGVRRPPYGLGGAAQMSERKAAGAAAQHRRW